MRYEIFGYKIEISKKLESDNIPDDLEQAIKVIKSYGMRAGSTQAQRDAAKKATEARQKLAREKIQNAINLLRLENRKLTNYAIAKESGCSINTIKKYLKEYEREKTQG